MNYYAPVPHGHDGPTPALVAPPRHDPPPSDRPPASAPLDPAQSPPPSARPRNNSIPQTNGSNLEPSPAPVRNPAPFSASYSAAPPANDDRPPYPFYHSDDRTHVGAHTGVPTNDEGTQTVVDQGTDRGHVDRAEAEEPRNRPQQPSVASHVQPQSSPVAAVPHAIAQPYSYVTVGPPGGFYPGAMPFPALYPAMPHYMAPVVPTPQTSTPPKPKRRQVKNACIACQRACKKCDDCRPCVRCVKYGISDECTDSQRKERKKGMKRGPYKKREQHPAKLLDFHSTHGSGTYSQQHMQAGEAAPAAHLHNALSYYPGYSGMPPPPAVPMQMGGFLKPDHGMTPFANPYYFMAPQASAEGAPPPAAAYPYAIGYAPPYATYGPPPQVVDHSGAAAGAYAGLYGSAPPSGESDSGSSSRRPREPPQDEVGEHRTPSGTKTPASATPTSAARSPSTKRTPRTVARVPDPTPAG